MNNYLLNLAFLFLTTILSFQVVAMEPLNETSPKLSDEAFRKICSELEGKTLSVTQCSELFSLLSKGMPKKKSAEQTTASPTLSSPAETMTPPLKDRKLPKRKGAKRKLDYEEQTPHDNNLDSEESKGDDEQAPEPARKKQRTIPDNVELICQLPNERHAYLSPEGKKPIPAQVIYIMLAVKDGEKEKIPYDQRIDINELAPDGINKKNLFDILLKMEIKLLKFLKDNPQYIARTTYAGQCENEINERIKNHFQEIKSDKKLHSTKVQMAREVGAAGYDLRVSYLIKNAPKDYLSIFECLVGSLFKVQTFGGSAQIGTQAASKQVTEYKCSSMRKNRLEEMGLLKVIENYTSTLYQKQFTALNS